MRPPTQAWNTRELGLFLRLTHYERRRRVYELLASSSRDGATLRSMKKSLNCWYVNTCVDVRVMLYNEMIYFGIFRIYLFIVSNKRKVMHVHTLYA